MPFICIVDVFFPQMTEIDLCSPLWLEAGTFEMGVIKMYKNYSIPAAAKAQESECSSLGVGKSGQLKKRVTEINHG
jgi:hypothetical protein